MGNIRKGRPGAVRKKSRGKAVGSGGQGRQALEGRGPTPKAEDRTYHPAYKAKLLREKAKLRRNNSGGDNRGGVRGGADTETVTGRNSVLEALRAKIPATTLYIAQRTEFDERVREILGIATGRDIPVMEITKAELDRLAGRDSVHQGVLLKVAAYRYAHHMDLLEQTFDSGEIPLFAVLDGVTDPRNLGAIIRSLAAFGGHGVIVPQRRSAGVTAAAWKTSAGAVARCPVAMASNLTGAIKDLKKQGVFVVGLDGHGETELPGLYLADRPLALVVGSEGSGLSRLVTEQCDATVSIPISQATESLNAAIAMSIACYEVAKLRAED
ncbi:23S rRNA (guanosine(2251)-2'-O)-methyltransferase RlmB [Canibacter sp. lx-45]|uniref:23S rRNA (guanosine(2251)-2'-O)-methyltransferase RlmB n=1 Tax=Canibacter zhuwentaonis TaxID=2837491 RepID=UPI001BDD0F92|nr:23S rRNA (guanosine(2251)-2'-O)-methyltransferase RlmB [Canibacter zhuwentaonis]MBT1034892.1 23S rRNA (guanosine(2251)-2'-O)-methyltransferase RlmB [Canibacter zhuwentaonis]